MSISLIKFLLFFAFFLFFCEGVARGQVFEKPTLKEVNKKRVYCQKSNKGKGLLDCLHKNLKDINGKLQSLESLIVTEIEKYPNLGGDYKKDERDLETIADFKDGLANSQKRWAIFSEANCNAFAALQTKPDSKTYKLRCLLDAANERNRELYFTYLITPDESDTLPVETSTNPHPCDKTVTANTLDIISCETKKLRRSETNLEKLLSKIRTRTDKKKFALLVKAQKAWLAYRDSSGNASGIYQSGGGTARGPIALAIKTADTDNRIDELKKIYLGRK